MLSNAVQIGVAVGCQERIDAMRRHWLVGKAGFDAFHAAGLHLSHARAGMTRARS